MIESCKGALLIHIIEADLLHLYFVLSMYGFFLYAHFPELLYPAHFVFILITNRNYP